MLNTDLIEGKWHQFSGMVKSKWGELTDDDIAEAEGDAERLSGKIQEVYGLSREEVTNELKVLEKRLNS